MNSALLFAMGYLALVEIGCGYDHEIMTKLFLNIGHAHMGKTNAGESIQLAFIDMIGCFPLGTIKEICKKGILAPVSDAGSSDGLSLTLGKMKPQNLAQDGIKLAIDIICGNLKIGDPVSDPDLQYVRHPSKRRLV